MLEVWNKIDALERQDREAIEGEAARRDDVVTISALGGEGVEALRERMAAMLRGEGEIRTIRLQASDGARISWLHARGDVLDQKMDGEEIALQVRLGGADWDKFQAL
jgi:GTP-binding protein HflX